MTDGESAFHPPDKSPNEHFAAAIKGIIDTAVTIRNVNFFAHRALNDLISVIDDVRLEYRQSPTIVQDNLRDTETSAFNYFRLTDIENILGHVERKVQQLDDIDQLIKNANVLEDVIIPPVRPTEGSGDEIEREPDEEPEFQRRLKTVLFVIANEFDIDINDPTQLSLSTGIVPDTITRERSYYAIEVPSISRIVFVCDQKGNITYVFDRAKALSEGADMETLAGFNKPELNELLMQHPGIGKRVRFSNNYVPGMVSTLKNSLEDKAQVTTARNYLNPEQRAQLISLNDVAKELVVNVDRLRKIIPEIKDFGEVALSRHGRLYTYEQQEKLRAALEARGEYAPRPEDDEMSLVGIARALGMEKKKAEKLVSAARTEIGEPKMKKFGGFVLEAFNGKDLGTIESKIPELYPPDLEDFPGHLTVNGIHVDTGVSVRTIERLIKQVEADNDDLHSVRVSQRGRRLAVYSPAFQAKIKELIRPFVEDDAEDLMTLQAFANSVGVVRRAVKNAYEKNANEIGELTTKGVTKKGAHLYLSQDQQAKLKAILSDTGRLVPIAPEGYLSMTRAAEKLRVAPNTLRQLTKLYREELGELKTYKFMSSATIGYSPEQQEVLRRAIKANKGRLN